MSQCAVTQLITDNKWKGKAVHPVVIKKARSIAKYHRNMRNAVRYLDKQFRVKANKEFDTNKEVDAKKYIAFVSDFFKVSNDRSKK